MNRDSLTAEVPRVSNRLFGPTVEGLLLRAVDAIRATVDGIVLVAVAEGAIMCRGVCRSPGRRIRFYSAL